MSPKKKVVFGDAPDAVASLAYPATRKNIPPTGIKAYGVVPEAPAVRHKYNPHLPPVLRSSARAYRVPLRVDNLWSSLDALERRHGDVAGMSPNVRKGYERRRREIELVCRAQADIRGFPQGEVRPHIPDPPDILVVPGIGSDYPDGHGVGVEVSELIDEVQHRRYSRAKKVVSLAVRRWIDRDGNSKRPVRLAYGITKELISGLKSGSRRKSNVLVEDAVHIVECSVREFLKPSSPVVASLLRRDGRLDSRWIPYIWGTHQRGREVREAIHVNVSMADSQRLESHYINPVSGTTYRSGRLFNDFGGDVTLDAERLHTLVRRKATKLRKQFLGSSPFGSLVLYLAGEYFPSGHGETGSLGILHVSDVHPERSVLYQIEPFSHVYIKCESSNYVVDGGSGRLAELQ